MVPTSTAEVRVSAEQDRLQRELQDLSRSQRRDCPADAIDFADQVRARHEAELRIRDVRRRLALAERALTRCRTGAYDTCVVCDGAIERERLEVNPLTDSCAGCGATP